MRTDRLQQLANFLRTVPPERFSMSTWADSPQFPECGTVACAGGWAAVLFSQDGLHLTPLWTAGTGVCFEGRTGFLALSAFFGITLGDAWFIFSEETYHVWPMTPTVVADRIDAKIANGTTSRSAT